MQEPQNQLKTLYSQICSLSEFKQQTAKRSLTKPNFLYEELEYILNKFDNLFEIQHTRIMQMLSNPNMKNTQSISEQVKINLFNELSQSYQLADSSSNKGLKNQGFSNLAKQLLETYFLIIQSYSLMEQLCLELFVTRFIRKISYSPKQSVEPQGQKSQKQPKQITKDANFFRQSLKRYRPQFIQIFLEIVKFTSYRNIVLLAHLCYEGYHPFSLSILDIQYVFQIIIKSRFKFKSQRRLGLLIDYLSKFIPATNQKCFNNLTYLTAIIKILATKYPKSKHCQQQISIWLTEKQQQLRLRVLMKGNFCSSPVNLESSNVQIHQTLFNSIVWIIIQRGKDCQIAWKIAQELMKISLTTRMVKNLVKKLQIKEKQLQRIEPKIDSKVQQVDNFDQTLISENSLNQWKDIFKLMTIALQMYPQSYNLIKYRNSRAFLIKKNPNFFIPKPSIFQFQLRTLPKTQNEQSLIAILFSKRQNKTLQYWVMLRQFQDQQNQRHCIFSIVQCQGGVIWRKVKQSFRTQQFRNNNKNTVSQTSAQLKSQSQIPCPQKWFSVWRNTIYIEMTEQELNLVMNLKKQDLQICYLKASLSLPIKDTAFTGISIGGGVIESSVDQVYSLSYYPYLSMQQLAKSIYCKEPIENMIKIDLLRLKTIPQLKAYSAFSKFKSKQIKMVQPSQQRKILKKEVSNLVLSSNILIQHPQTTLISQQSFINIIKKLGDLDLFFLITSHIIKKYHDPKLLVSMIIQIMKFFNRFVEIKGVKEIKLTKQEQQSRVSNILCLCWLISKETKGKQNNQPQVATVIMALMKLLGIRGGGQMKKMEISGMLDVLCNYGFWQNLNFADQMVLLKQTRALLLQSLNGNFVNGKQTLDKTRIRKNSESQKHIRQNEFYIFSGLKFWKRLLIELVYFYRIKTPKGFFNSVSSGEFRSSRRSIDVQQQLSAKKKNGPDQENIKLKLQAQIVKTLQTYLEQLIQKLFSTQGLQQKFYDEEGKRIASKDRISQFKSVFESLLQCIQLLIEQKSNYVDRFTDKGLGIQLSFVLKKISKLLFQKYLEAHSSNSTSYEENSMAKINKLKMAQLRLISCQQILQNQKNVTVLAKEPGKQFKYYSPPIKTQSFTNLVIYNQTPSMIFSDQNLKNKKFPRLPEETIQFLAQLAEGVSSNFNKLFMLDNVFEIFQYELQTLDFGKKKYKMTKLMVTDDAIKENLNDFIVYIQSINPNTYKNLVYKKCVDEYNQLLYKSVSKVHLFYMYDFNVQKTSPKGSFSNQLAQKLSFMLHNQKTEKQSILLQRLFKSLTCKVFKKIPIDEGTFECMLRFYIMQDSISCLPTYKLMSYISKQFVKNAELQNKNNNYFQSSALSNIKFVNTKIKERVIKVIELIVENLTDLYAFQLNPSTKAKKSFSKQHKVAKILCKIHIFISMFSQLTYENVFNILTLMEVCGYQIRNLELLKLQLSIRQILSIGKNSLKQKNDRPPKAKNNPINNSQFYIQNQSSQFQNQEVQGQQNSNSSPLQRYLAGNSCSIIIPNYQLNGSQQQDVFKKLNDLVLHVAKFESMISQASILKIFKCETKNIHMHLQNIKINLKDGLIESLKKLNPRDANYFQQVQKKILAYKDILEVHILPTIQEQTISKIQQYCPAFRVRQPFFQSKENRDFIKRNQKIQPEKISIDSIRQYSNQLLTKFIVQRRMSLISVEKVWGLVEQNNKYFWQLFYGKQKWYSLDSFTSSLKMPIFVKVSGQKPEFDLPRMAQKQTADNASKFHSIVQQLQQSQDEDNSRSSSSIFNDTAKLYSNITSMNQEKVGRTETYCDFNILNKSGSIISYSAMSQDKPKKKILQQPVSPIKKKKQRMLFKVFLIKVDKIYSGKLYARPCEKNVRKFDQCEFKQVFTQNNVMYDQICATQSQRRTLQQIDKNRKTIKINLNRHCRILRKKYLFFDCALQIYSGSQNETYLFFFWDKTGSQREQFIKKFIKSDKIQNYNKYNTLNASAQNILSAPKLANYYKKLWQCGILTNFKYLMKLNDLANRSFESISQYYIFPWVIKDFQSKQIKLNQLDNQEIFRDLTKPIGKANPQRFQIFQKRYRDNQGIYGKSRQDPGRQISQIKQKNSSRFNFNIFQRKNSIKQKKHNANEKRSLSGSISSLKQKISNHNYFAEAFLYGSFYSNPAIISNFMLRINPFSTQHYKLQTNRFDHADRLFFSIRDQYNSSMSNISDVKQLIPEFYSSWEFLINRSQWKLGVRQNQAIVNDVILPNWVKQSTKRPEQFIFKMREALESEYATKNIHKWIDYIFGWKNIKKQALKNDNLYPATVYYINTSQMDFEDRQSIIMCYKQFGQNPQCLFSTDHPPFEGFTSSQIIKNQVSNSELQLYNPGIDDAVILGHFTMTQTKIIKQRIVMYQQKKQLSKKIAESVNQGLDSSRLKFKKNERDCQLLQKFRKQTMFSLKKRLNAYRKQQLYLHSSIYQQEVNPKNHIVITDMFILQLSSDNKLLICSQKPKKQSNQKEGFEVLQVVQGSSNKSSIMSFLSSFSKKKPTSNSPQNKLESESAESIKSSFYARTFSLNRAKQTETSSYFSNSSILEQEASSVLDFHEQIYEENLKKPIQAFQIQHLMDQQYSLHKVILYLRNGNICFREIRQKYSSSNKNVPTSLQFSNEDNFMPTKICFYEDIKVCKSFIILRENNTLHFICQKEFSIEDNIQKSCKIFRITSITEPKQVQYCLLSLPEFTQHESIITHFQVSEQLCLSVSIDLGNTLFVLALQLPPKKIFVRYSFTMKDFFLSEKVTSLMIHDLGLIILMTNLNRILVYNLMGELVIKSVIQIINQNIESFEKLQKLSSVCLFSGQRPQLIFGSTNGNVYKISIFDLSCNGSQSNPTVISAFTHAIKLLFRQRHKSQAGIGKQSSQTKSRIFIQFKVTLSRLQRRSYTTSHKASQRNEKIDSINIGIIQLSTPFYYFFYFFYPSSYSILSTQTSSSQLCYLIYCNPLTIPSSYFPKFQILAISQRSPLLLQSVQPSQYSQTIYLPSQNLPFIK